MDITADFKVEYSQTFDSNKTRIKKTNFSLDCDAGLSVENYTTDNGDTGYIIVNITWGESGDEDYIAYDDYVLMYKFKADYKKGTWHISAVYLSVDTNASIFINPTNDPTIVNGTVSDSDKLIGTLDFKRSYRCDSDNKYTFNVEEPKNVTGVSSMSATISDFRVQAFQFKDPTKYGNTARCSKDIKGSKIVPIAVGAALAGLVIIVLVAYIIGRLRSRKQSSYEALS